MENRKLNTPVDAGRSDWHTRLGALISSIWPKYQEWGKDVCIFGPARFNEPLFKYLSFRLDDIDEGRPSSTRYRLLIASFAVIIVVVLISVNRPLIGRFLLMEDVFWINAPNHSILEIFNGLISVLIGLILYREYSASGRRNILFLVLAFFSIGILDFFHAFSDYCHNMFVWFHSFSAFFGSLFFFGSIFIADRNSENNAQSIWTRRFYVLFGTLMIFTFAVLSIKLYSRLPGVLSVQLPHHTHVTLAKGHFSKFIYSLNFASSILFLFSGVVFYRGFLRINDVIYLIFGTSALLFFSSELSFTFSKLWDPMWWYWHVIKVIVFSGLLIGLAYGFTQTVYRLYTSKIRLANSFREIERKNVEIQRAYGRLKETQKYLKESEKLASIGKMAAGLAHEIRNPLGAITNSLGVLKRYSTLDRDGTELIDIVEKEMERLNDLVEDFMSFSKPSSLNKNHTDLHALIDETLSLSKLGDNVPAGIEIRRDYASDLPALMLDRNHIKQALLNVFMNAVQAMPAGGTLTIKTGYNESENEVKVTVADTGVGMSRELLTQVFQPFFTTKDKGLGLGVNIVHKIMTEHGGYVLISSRCGEGTQIQLNFPVPPQVERTDGLAVSERYGLRNVDEKQDTGNR